MGAEYTFKSRIDGKNADVEIWADRIEWSVTSKVTRRKDTQMIPLRSVTSIQSGRDGLTNHKVTVHAGAQAIEMRADKGTCEHVKQLVSRLMLG